MTATDKAKELVNQFYFSLPNNGSFEGINSIPRRWEEAVRCALIAVDEILWEIIKYADNSKEYVVENSQYWQEVKQEIDKLWNEETK
jgi:hypothetical protein